MKVPDRWYDYSNMGNRIPGTRFICFKVPLKRPDCGFLLRDLTDYCPDLGIVIDLTNTNKYYNPKPLDGLGIQYKKIFTEGKVLPSNSVVREFFDVVNKFLEENTDNDRVVGVHCTHGLNRTGYLVCRYMVQMLDVAPDQAISDFNSARGHEQERPVYLEDLRLARWKDEDPLSYAKLDEKDNNNTSAKRRRSDRGDGWYPGAAYAPSPAASPRPNTHIKFDDSGVAESSSADLNASQETTPRGTKRARETDDCVHRWEDKDGEKEDEEEKKEALEDRKNKYKAAMGATVFADTDRYDPYFYQQRTGGGKSRRSKHGLPGKTREEEVNPRKYKGPRKHRSPPRLEKEDSTPDLGLDDKDPLNVSDKEGLESKFLLETPPNKVGTSREKKTPALFSPEDDEAKKAKKTVLFSPESDPVPPESDALFSPEAAGETGGKRRKSKMRYEPY